MVAPLAPVAADALGIIPSIDEGTEMASLHWVRAVLVMLVSIAVYLAVASFGPPRWFELGVMILGAVCSAAAAIGPWKTS